MLATTRAKVVTATLFVVVSAAAGLAATHTPTNATSAPLVLGELPYQKLISQKISDKGEVLVNVANGNMIVKTVDLNIRSAGPDLVVTRYFNDRGNSSGQVGSRGTLSVGADVSITANTNGSATYQGPSGFKVTFPSDGAGGYTSPPEYTGAKLSALSGGGWELRFNKSGDVYTFNSNGKQIKHADAAGLAITYAYNADGTLASATDAQGKVTTFTNYSGTNVGTITDPAGRTVQYLYDASGRLADVTDTNGKTWHFEYWDGTNLTWMVDPRDYSTTFNYDTSNRVTAINYNDYLTSKRTWTYTYNAGYTQVIDPLNHDDDYWYDSSGRVTSVVNALGNSVGTSWDSNNNQTTTTSPSSQVTTMVYDSLNNLTERQSPATAGGSPGAKETYEYADVAHPYHPSKKTDAAGNTVAYTYNVNGNVASSTSASSGGSGMGSTTTKYQGDPDGSGGTVNCGAKAGQICSFTDARGYTTTYGYDTLGNVTTITPPGPVGPRTYTYDNLSRPQTITDGNGSKTTIAYDGADRPTTLTYAADNSTVSYTYDNHGNMVSRSDAAGTTSWDYDGFNAVIRRGQTGKTDITYTYDNAGNLTTEQGPGGTTTYSYDIADQIANIHQSSNNANTAFTFTDARLTSVSLPGGITETITYDNSGRQTSIKAMKGATTLTHYTGTYEQVTGTDTALLQTETNQVTGESYAYGYDGLNRLIDVNGTGTGSHDYTYTYDANGNRTQKSKDGAYSGIYGYNEANQLVTDGGAESGTFDLAGNQTSAGSGLSMFYNAKNQTSSLTTPDGTNLPMGYTDAGQVERTQIGGKTQHNGQLGVYSDTLNSATTYYHYLPGSKQPMGMTTASGSYYYLKDLRGSVVRVTDINGTVVNSYSYEPYGAQLTATESVDNPYRFTGGYYDSYPGLYKLGARYYSSMTEDARNQFKVLILLRSLIVI